MVYICSKEPNDAHIPKHTCPRDNMMPLYEVGNNSKLIKNVF